MSIEATNASRQMNVEAITEAYIQSQKQMNTYLAFYNHKIVTIHAPSLYAAKIEAMKVMNVPLKKHSLVSIELASLADGSLVVHTATN